MTRNEIFQRIVEILSDSFELDPASIKLESTLYEELDLDSIDAIDVFVQLREVTGRRPDPAEAPQDPDSGRVGHLRGSRGGQGARDRRSRRRKRRLAPHAMSLPAPIELLPHRPPMLLIDEVRAWQGRKITCVSTIRAGDRFVRDGRVSSVLCIELFAQSAAALVALVHRERPGHDDSMGALLGTPQIELHVPWLEVGDELTIECEEVWTIDPAAQLGWRALASR